MNKFVAGFLGLAVGVGGTWMVLRSHGGAEPAKAEAAAAPAEKPKPNPLQLNAAKRTAAGITLAKPTSTQLAPEVAGFGRVLDPVPLIGLAADVESDRAALTASEKELARVQKLFAADNNASAQAVETAEAAAQRDRTALAAARGKLIATIGHPLADTARLDQMVAGLEQGRAVARVDIAAGDAIGEGVKSVRLSLIGSDQWFDADILGAAPTADPQVQGRGFLVLLRDHPMPAGAALQVTLPGPGEAAKVLVVPRSAVVYHQGSAWIYTLGEEDTFERKIVTVIRAVGDGLAIRGATPDDVKEDDQIATGGVQQILSAELQAGGAPDEG